MSETTDTKKKGKKKVSDRPKRPLSAYNLFFQSERERILRLAPERPEGRPRRSHGKIGFAPLARAIADRWNSIEDWERRYYDEKAAQDKIRYTRELEEWNKARANSDQNDEEESAKEDEEEKKPSAKSSGRLKIVPPPIAPRLPISPMPETAIAPRIAPAFASNTAQIDGSMFPSMSLAVWQPPSIEPPPPSETGTNLTNPYESPRIPTLFASTNALDTMINTQGAEEPLQFVQQPTRQLQPDNRAYSDSSLVRLANELDEESLNFISNLFQQGNSGTKSPEQQGPRRSSF